MKTKFNVALILGLSIFISSCKKDDDSSEDETQLTNEQIQQSILNDVGSVVILDSYKDLENKMTSFYNSCNSFSQTQSQTDLESARQAWKDVRGVWEKSEAFLFGPVSTNNIDPSTDTWPVDYNSLDSLLNTSNAFTQSFINSLGDELKGYHPSEYLLWGNNGTKLNTDFTPREMEFLVALAADLQIKATSLRNSWDPQVAGNFLYDFRNAGASNSVYPSHKAAFEEVVNALAGICDEVANGKMNEPFVAADPSLEESPFSQNSLIDFKNNITGVKNIYLGNYANDGEGLDAFLKKNNLSLHNKITADIESALISFDGITVPFGQAITTQPTQVQNTINRINTLKATFEDDLLPFIQQTITN